MVDSVIWMPAQVPDWARPASTLPHAATLPRWASGPSSRYAGWDTDRTAESVPRCGSCTMHTPVAGSVNIRSAAASPGNANVPAGRGRSIFARYSVWPTALRAAKVATVGTHSTACWPPTRTNATATNGPAKTTPTSRPVPPIPDSKPGQYRHHRDADSGEPPGGETRAAPRGWNGGRSVPWPARPNRQ